LLSSYKIYRAAINNIRVLLRVKCLIFLSDFTQIRSYSTVLKIKSPPPQKKARGSRAQTCGRSPLRRRTDMTQLMESFRDLCERPIGNTSPTMIKITLQTFCVVTMLYGLCMPVFRQNCAISYPRSSELNSTLF
jgi:hypothetical protein